MSTHFIKTYVFECFLITQLFFICRVHYLDVLNCGESLKNLYYISTRLHLGIRGGRVSAPREPNPSLPENLGRRSLFSLCLPLGSLHLSHLHTQTHTHAQLRDSSFQQETFGPAVGGSLLASQIALYLAEDRRNFVLLPDVAKAFILPLLVGFSLGGNLRSPRVGDVQLHIGGNKPSGAAGQWSRLTGSIMACGLCLWLRGAGLGVLRVGCSHWVTPLMGGQGHSLPQDGLRVVGAATTPPKVLRLRRG